MGDDASELGSVSLHFDERSAKRALFRSLGERLLQQTAEPVLLALNPEDVLNFLATTYPELGNGTWTSRSLPDGGEEITFLTMELLHGVTLSERLASGPLPTEEAIPIACQLAAGLSAAHDAGVVHRDFKSSNVILMVTSTGPRAVITDFGLSCALSPKDRDALRLTGTGQLLGTPAYFAPEQLEGQVADARTDIFAFGAVLYEMLTGRKAFEGKSQASLIASIMSSEPPPLTGLQPLVPDALDVGRGARNRQQEAQVRRDGRVDTDEANGLLVNFAL